MPPQVSIAKGSVDVVLEVTVGSVDVAVGDIGLLVETVTSVVPPLRRESAQPLTPSVANTSSPILKNCERRTFPVLAEHH
jgi:hypothetical protein